MDDKESGNSLIQQLKIDGVSSRDVTIIQNQMVGDIPTSRRDLKRRRRVHVMETMLLDLISRLPEPKFKSLTLLVYHVCTKQLGTQSKAANYLGTYQSYVSKLLSDSEFFDTVMSSLKDTETRCGGRSPAPCKSELLALKSGLKNDFDLGKPSESDWDFPSTIISEIDRNSL